MASHKDRLQTRDRLVMVKNAAGRTLEEVAVTAGDYLVIDGDGGGVLRQADFAHTCDAMPGGGPDNVHVWSSPLERAGDRLP